jgi:hypothetical protein
MREGRCDFSLLNLMLCMGTVNYILLIDVVILSPTRYAPHT